MLKSTRFQKGDIIHIVKYYDVGDEVIEEGIVLIKEYNPSHPNYACGVYEMEPLKGTIGFIRYNAESFDKLPYLVWLGNTNEDSALRLLYGR